MKHVMLDLETLGTTPGSVILSIGAVQFDPYDKTRKLGAEFKVAIEIEDSIAIGFRIDGKTLKWWMDQNIEVFRRQIFGAEGVKSALSSFSKWLHETRENKQTPHHAWGNSASFDCGLLSSYYRKVGVEQPWDYRLEMCYRTMNNLLPIARSEWLQRDANKSHDPVYDAKYQANHVQLVYSKYGITENPIEHEAITGFHTLEAQAAYDTGREHEGLSIAKFIETWKPGEGNSHMGQELMKVYNQSQAAVHNQIKSINDAVDRHTKTK